MRLPKIDAWLYDWSQERPIQMTVVVAAFGSFVGWVVFLILDKIPVR